MVHRPADSRLLTNLLTHEKDYSKHLNTLLDYSNASLASFSAYAAASSPPASQVILSVAGSLAGADDALRRYASAVDEWREHLKELKSLEDEVGNIMRDREILVTRLIKASKSQKPNRDSLLLNQPYPSSSSLSLKSDFTSSLNPSKLVAAQSELQACEAHLAAKGHELDLRRVVAVREGLSIRCRALVDCGWLWGEAGKEALRVLGALSAEGPQLTSNEPPNKPLPDPANRPSSDLSSLSPSQSASQIEHNLPPPLPLPKVIQISLASPDPTSHIYSNVNYVGYGSSSQQSHSAPASPQHHAYTSIQIPPAHAISDLAMPSSTSTPMLSPPPTASTNTNANSRRNASMSGSQLKHVLTRRITEEDLNDVGGSSEEEEDEEQRHVQIVENPRFAAGGGAGEPPDGERASVQDIEQRGRRFSLRAPSAGARLGSSTSLPGIKRERKTSSAVGAGGSGSGFFGSLRVLFRGHHREGSGSISDKEVGDEKVGRGKKDTGKWETRTEKNLKGLERSGAGSDDEDGGPMNVVERSIMSPSTSVAPMITAATPTPKARKRVASDLGVPAHTAISGPVTRSAAGSPTGGRRLKKGRSVKGPTRSASVPPATSSIQSSGVAGDGIKRVQAWVGKQEGENEHEQKGATHEEQDKGWASDGGAISTVAETVTRKKSKGKGKAIATAAMNSVNTTHAPNSNRSKNSSLLGTASAPPALLLGQNKTGAVRRASVGGASSPSYTVINRRGESIDEGSARLAKSSMGKATMTGKTGRVGALVPAHSHPPGVGQGSTSLMSIVEGVARNNREAWATGGILKSGGGATLPSGMMEVVRAPPSLGRELLEVELESGGMEKGRSTAADGGASAVIGGAFRAPGSVLDAQKTTTGNRNALPPSASASGSMGADISAGESTTKRPAKSPLRSALRNSSRTPSPLPPLPPTLPETSGLSPSSRVVPASRVKAYNDRKGKDRAVDRTDEKSDDGASVSSYDTGHEVFEDALEDPPPTLSPHNYDYAHANGHTQYENKTPRQQTSRPNNGSLSQNQPGSDVSASTMSTEAPLPALPRRKSVRVSLQPTFSPTPPAIDDDDDGEGATGASGSGRHPPWSGTKANGNEKSIADPDVRDMWEDSSEEDVEYQRAKKLLTRAAKRERKVW